MENPRISIIVPVYKTERLLNKCIESIVCQTYDKLEIILVDDSSPDGCPAMCDEWAERDERIRVMHIENNGVANARNQALRVASGEYIGFVDSDDYIEPDMYEVLLGRALEDGADICVCDYQINDEGNDADENRRAVSREEALRQICTGEYKYGVLWNKLYRAEILKGLEMPPLSRSEDLVFNYYAFSRAGVVSEIDSRLYHYYQNDESVVHSEFCEGSLDAVTAREIMLEAEKGTALEPYAIKGLIVSCYVAINGIILSGRLREKYPYLRRRIMDYRHTIWKSGLYPLKEKIKTALFALLPSVYSLIIKRKGI